MEAHDLIFFLGALGLGLLQVVVLVDELRRRARDRRPTGPQFDRLSGRA